MGNLGSWTHLNLDTPDLTSPVTLGKSFNFSELRLSHLESWEQFSELEMVCLSHWPSGLWLILPGSLGPGVPNPGQQGLRACVPWGQSILGLLEWLPSWKGKAIWEGDMPLFLLFLQRACPWG